MCFSLDHSEIMKRKAAVIPADDFSGDFPVGIYFFIVHNNRVHMNTHHDIQIFADSFFNIVYHIVQPYNIGIAGHFCVG